MRGARRKPRGGLGVARSQVGWTGWERTGSTLPHPCLRDSPGTRKSPCLAHAKNWAPDPEMTMSDGGPLGLLRTSCVSLFSTNSSITCDINLQKESCPNQVRERFPLNAEPLDGRNSVLFTRVSAVTEAC